MALTRTTEQWRNAQFKAGAKEEDIKPLFICLDGKTMEGWINVKTGARTITALRRATNMDEIKAGVVKIGRKLGILQTPPPAQKIILPDGTEVNV